MYDNIILHRVFLYSREKVVKRRRKSKTKMTIEEYMDYCAKEDEQIITIYDYINDRYLYKNRKYKDIKNDIFDLEVDSWEPINNTIIFNVILDEIYE